VLPVYNGEDYIEQAVRSVLAQSYSDFELLVVDDGSTDRTWAILARLTMEDARIRLIRQKNQRLPSALAAGFRAATGEFLTWTSADNVLKPGCLETLVDELRAHPERDLVYANLDLTACRSSSRRGLRATRCRAAARTCTCLPIRRN
jgi:glycosyltransferase involved in cell wall biosynthesis